MKNNYSILIVDDEDVQLTVFEELFIDAGFKCYYSNNAEDAIKIFETKDVDIIIADRAMPKVDGIELIRRIRNINKNQPLVYLISANMEVNKEDVTNLFIKRLIDKPFDFDELVEIIQSDMA